MTDQDPPLYDALRALHGLNPRHRLREDHVYDPIDPDGPWNAIHEPAAEPHPNPVAYGLPPEHVYAADDDPDGPASPPLGEEPETPSSVVELVACERCREPIVRVLRG